MDWFTGDAVQFDPMGEELDEGEFEDEDDDDDDDDSEGGDEDDSTEEV